jgi:predicted MFS family arabinose efflux permease
MILGSRSAASPSSALGSVVGASAMGYVLDHGGMTGSLVLTVGCMILTVLLTLPFLRSHASETTAKSLN